MFYIRKKYDITLFNLEMIYATLDLIDFIQKNEMKLGYHYSYFSLISGQDFPILTNQTILNILKKKYPFCFIDIDPLCNGNWVEKSFSKYYVLKNIESKYLKSMKINCLKKLFVSIPRKILTEFLTIIHGSPKKILLKNGMIPYGDNQWWIISDVMIQEVQRLANSKDIEIVFKHVFSPDETFFQTLCMNSTLKNIIEKKDGKSKHQNCMTYADFHDEKGNPYGHPKVLTEKDFVLIKNFIKRKTYFFIRKIDKKSNVLLQMINQEKER